MLLKYALLIFTLFFLLFLTFEVTDAQDLQLMKTGVVRIYNPILKAQGTGFIIHINEDQTKAIIVTSSHVVDGIELVDVYLANKSEAVKGKILNREEDELKGLALLIINGSTKLFSGLTPFEFGNSSEIGGGESGYVIGFPSGTSIPTIVAANIARREGRNIVFAGTINPGNSGGPLLIGGKVIGMVTDVASFAYATPAEDIMHYVNGIEPNLAKEIKSPKIKPASDKITILVADFKNNGQKNYQVTETIITQLRNATKDYPDIRIQLLGEHISAGQGSEIARAKGKEYDADIMLWGEYKTAEEEVLVNINFEILKKQEGLDLSHQSEILRAPIGEIKKNFNIQTRLSNKMAYLTLLTTGLARLEADDYDGAISRLTSALAQPDAPEQLADRSDIFFHRSRAYVLKALFLINDEKLRTQFFSLGIADLNKYISIKPGDAAPYILRANAYLVIGNQEGTLADTNKALELDPKNYTAYVIRGMLYMSNDNTDRAINSLNKAIQLMGDDTDEGTSSYFYYIRGTLHMVKEDYNGAINDFSKIIKIAPSSPMSAYMYLMRGAAFAAKGDYDSAVDDFNLAIKLDNNNPIFYYARGHAYDDNANNVGAIDDYARAISIMNNSGATKVTFGAQSIELLELYEDRAESYENMNRYDRAIADLEQVERLTNDPEKRRDVAQKIKQLRMKNNR